MDVVHSHCAGIDAHKKSVAAAIIATRSDGSVHGETRSFGTTTADLLELSDWLASYGITLVAVQRRGDYWTSVFSILEGSFEVWLIDRGHPLARVPARGAGVTDAEWNAVLLRHGLLRPSLVAPTGQRELRELTRSRSAFVHQRARLAKRLQELLESANIRLAHVGTDLGSASAQAILEAIIGGQAEPAQVAELARGRLPEKREQLARALRGRVRPHHCFLLTELLCQIDALDETTARFDAEIRACGVPFESVGRRVQRRER